MVKESTTKAGYVVMFQKITLDVLLLTHP